MLAGLALLLALLLAAAGYAGARVAWSMSKTSFRRQLASAHERWQLQHQQHSPATRLESVTLGWLNIILQNLWTPVLEKHVAGLTADLLQRALNEALVKNATRGVWRFLDSIALEEISFGLVPPSFHNCVVEFDPAASLLKFDLDTRFASSSAQAVMLVRTRAIGVLAPLSLRMEATHAQFSGRLKLQLLLGPEPPGIRGIYYSFASQPVLDIAVRPLGLPLPPELPGLAGALGSVLSRIISRRLVEPHKRYFDLQRVYTNKHVARAGGPGGLLRIVVLSASHLVAGDAGGSSGRHSPGQQQQQHVAGAAGAAGQQGAVSSYCIVKYGRQVLRTPIAHTAGDAAVFNWQFSLALPADISQPPEAAAAALPASSAATSGAGAAGGAKPAGGPGTAVPQHDVVSIAVYDAQTIGDATLLGTCRVSLSSLGLSPNSTPKSLLLPLRKAANPKAHVQITAAWLKSTKPPGVSSSTSMGPGSDGSRSQAVPAAAAVQQELLLQQHSSKGVTWHDEQKFTHVLQQLAEPSQRPQQEQQKRPVLSRSAGSSPLLKLPPPHLQQAVQQLDEQGPLGLRQRSHQRSATFDSASLGSSAAAVATDRAAAATGTPAASSRPAVAGPRIASDEPADFARLFSQLVPAKSSSSLVTQEQPPPQQQQQQQPPQQQAQQSTWLASWSTWLTSSTSSDTTDPAFGQEEAAAGPAAAAGVLAGLLGGDDGGGMMGSSSGGSAASPFVLLSQVVQLQRQMQQQRADLERMQQRLQTATQRQQQLQQQRSSDARSALLTGARFLLHPDASQAGAAIAAEAAGGAPQAVLVYLVEGTVVAAAAADGDDAAAASPGEGSGAGVERSRGSSSSPWAAKIQHLRSKSAGTLFGLGAAAQPQQQAAAAASSARQQQHQDGSVHGGRQQQQPPSQLYLVVAALPDSRWQRRAGFGRAGELSYEQGASPRNALPVLQLVPVASIRSVHSGIRRQQQQQLLRVPQAAGPGRPAPGAAPAAPAAAASCLTLEVWEAGTGAGGGGGGVRCVQLQLPSVGNGRSRDEWVFAIKDLLATAAQQDAAGSAAAPAAAGMAAKQAVPTVQAAAAAAAVQHTQAAAAGAGGVPSPSGRPTPPLQQQQQALVATATDGDKEDASVRSGRGAAAGAPAAAVAAAEASPGGGSGV